MTVEGALREARYALIADLVLEDRQAQASRMAPISAIPVRQSEPARKGAGRWIEVGKKKGAVLQIAVTCSLACG